MGNTSWRRWLAATIMALIGVYALLILLAYRTPPLNGSGTTTQVAENAYVIGVDLSNAGRRPVVLRSAHVEFVPQAEVTAVVSFVEPDARSACVASAAAVYPDHCNPHQMGAVPGWRVDPTRPRHNMHGLRVELPLDAAPDASVLVVSYRYLGWPFAARIGL